MFQENKARQIFRKTNIFLPPDTHTYVCISEGKKMFFFWKIWRALFSWNTRFEICPFALLLTKSDSLKFWMYYWFFQVLLTHLSRVSIQWKHASPAFFKSLCNSSKKYSKDRSRHQRCFVKKGVLKNFTISTGKDLCLGLFLIKLQAWRPPTLVKRDPNTVVPL